MIRMPKSPEPWRALIARQLLGDLSPEEFSELEVVLLEQREARDLYRSACNLDTRLRRLAEDRTNLQPAPPVRPPRGRQVLLLAVAATVLLTGVLAWSLLDRTPAGEIVARLDDADDVHWVNDSPGANKPLRVGQRLELASGYVNLLYRTGAGVRLQGPAIYEIESSSSGFLIAGVVTVRADTPESKGFTIRTRSAKVIDLGTEFILQAGLDGQSQIRVTSGAVDVEVAGSGDLQRLNAGDALGVEPGVEIIQVRIESGDATSAFHFPTIDPPSDQDAADASVGKARIQVVRGKLHKGKAPSGDPLMLLNGRGQSREDAWEESVFFLDNSSGWILLDLGDPLSIARINTYSWHQNLQHADNRLRAVQKFTLYGYLGDEPPKIEGTLAVGVLVKAGWKMIVRVNSDDFFHVKDPLRRPAQQACSITAARGSVGRYRYLLWDVQPTRHSEIDAQNNTFYGEFDVYAQP